MILFISSAGLSACSTVPEGQSRLPRLHNGWNIRYGYSTDGYYRKVYILLLHPVDDSCISFQSQYRTQILLGSGVAEGAAAYVVGTGFVVLQYILKSIGGTAYNVLRAQNPACVGYGHVFLSRCTPSACSFAPVPHGRQ